MNLIKQLINMMKENTFSMKNWTLKWLLSGLVFLLLLMDSIGKFIQPEEVIRASEELGFNSDQITIIGIILLICSIIYMIPRFAIIGAILLTGYLGGAVAVHILASNPLFSHTFFPVYVGVLAWIGLYFRNKAMVIQLFKP